MAAVLVQTAEQVVAWLRARVPAGAHMSADSRQLNAGDVFLAYPGYARDGREFVAGAFQLGASACVVEAQGAEGFMLDDRTACVRNLKALAGEVASLFYNTPSAQLDVIAVTGTNGKTTVTNWIAQSLQEVNIPCAVIGTLGMGIARKLHDTGMTTPDPIALQRFLRSMVEANVKAVAMEASSIGIEEGRLNGTQIHTAVFTNFTQDHLDYHASMTAYAAAKRKLFDRNLYPSLKHVVLNVADETGAKWARELSADSDLHLNTYAVEAPADWQATAPLATANGVQFDVKFHAQSNTAKPAFIGHHNVENFLACLAVVQLYTQDFAQTMRACETVQSVSGRLELIHRSGAPMAVVDYAHTPDAMTKALSALRPTTQQRKGKLWSVFGCGGDRDRSKRPLMAQAAEQEADAVVVTSDNPRTEDARVILNEICQGLSKPAALIEIDRRLAIHQTIAMAQPEDVVLIAGKGHEDYQIIGADKLPFSDQTEARLAQAAYLSRVPQGAAA
jgi:UDP-N-acetylmuramyl-tripeptide synthetase